MILGEGESLAQLAALQDEAMARGIVGDHHLRRKVQPLVEMLRGRRVVEHSGWTQLRILPERRSRA